jgi:hypothetical protein
LFRQRRNTPPKKKTCAERSRSKKYIIFPRQSG